MTKKKQEMTEYLRNRRQQKDAQLRYDFMPSLLALVERPAHRWGALVLWLIVALVAVFGAWSWWSFVDVVVVGQGSLLPDSHIQVIKTAESGVVQELLVEEGQHVVAGTVLLRFEDQLLTDAIHHKETALARLASEQAVITQYQQNRQATVVVADYPEAHQAAVARLVLENAVVQKQLAEQYSQVTIAQYEALLGQRLLELRQQQEQWEAELAQLRYRATHMQVVAPTTGYVSGLVVTHVGQVVAASEPLVRIVPTETQLIFESTVSDKDIANIRVGMPAKIKLQAFPYATHGVVHGTVLAISPAAVPVEGRGVVYVVRVALAQELIADIPATGLSGTVEIKTGERRVLSYFLDPIIDSWDKSLKEP